MRSNLTHACIDLAIQALPLFVVHGRGRQRPALTLGPISFGNTRIEVHAPVALTDHDQSVFYALHGLAAIQPADLAPDELGEARDGLQLSELAAQQLTASVRCTSRELHWATGASSVGTDSLTRVVETLHRLASVDLCWTQGLMNASCRLISVVEAANGLVVTLNPRSARAALRVRGSDRRVCQHARIDLDERRHLSTEAGRLLHSWLSATLGYGRTWRYHEESLIAHAWIDSERAKTIERRRTQLRTALEEIGTLEGWTVSSEKGRVIVISRAFSAASSARKATVRGQRDDE